MTPENKMLFIINNTNKQEEIIKEVYNLFDTRFFLWKVVNKELNKMPDVFKQFLHQLDEWKSNFLTQSSFYPNSKSTMEALNIHETQMNLLLNSIKDKKVSDKLVPNLKKILEDALGILLEMELCLPTEEDIQNGTV